MEEKACPRLLPAAASLFRMTVRRFEELYGEVIDAIRGTRADADEIRHEG